MKIDSDVKRYYKTGPTRRSRIGEGAEDGRFTRSTDDPGPIFYVLLP